MAVIVMAFLAAATVLVVVLQKATQPTRPSVSGDEDTAASVLGFPPIVKADHLDTAPPTLFGGGREDASIDPLTRGAVLFVFADPTVETGLDSARVAIDVHRRLRARDVRVVLVVPRGAVAGNDPAEASVRQALLENRVVTDVLVLLDPSDEKGAGHLKRTAFGLHDESGAVLWEDGRETWRITPHDPGGAIPLSHMKTVVDHLWNDYPAKAIPPPPGPATDPTPGRPMPSDEEIEAGGEEDPPPGQK